jgi:hypothetical protein
MATRRRAGRRPSRGRAGGRPPSVANCARSIRSPRGRPTTSSACSRRCSGGTSATRTSGAYVPKWSGQGRSFPGDVSDAYRQAFLVERVLDRGQFYCFTVLGSGGGRATEAIARLTRVDDELRVRVLATAQRDATQAVSDFCFFYAHEGTNVEVPASARGAFTPEFAALLFDGDPQAALQRARSADDWIRRERRHQGLAADDPRRRHLVAAPGRHPPPGGGPALQRGGRPGPRGRAGRGGRRAAGRHPGGPGAGGAPGRAGVQRRRAGDVPAADDAAPTWTRPCRASSTPSCWPT